MYFGNKYVLINKTKIYLKERVMIMNSIYQKIGGKETIDTIVNKFFEKNLSDNRVCNLLSRVDLDCQKLRTTIFLTILMGERFLYKDKEITGKYLHPQELTENELGAFEDNFYIVLKEMNLLVLLPTISNGLRAIRLMSKVYQNNTTNH